MKAVVGSTVIIAGKPYIAAHGDRGCEGCAFKDVRSCTSIPTPDCGSTFDGVIFLEGVDAVTYKLTGKTPNDPDR